jgi:hypothetical protein
VIDCLRSSHSWDCRAVCLACAQARTLLRCDAAAGDLASGRSRWNEIAEFDDLNDVPDAVWAMPEDIHNQMMAEIGRSTYAPLNATAFITDFIRRVNEAQRARPWIWPLQQALT